MENEATAVKFNLFESIAEFLGNNWHLIANLFEKIWALVQFAVKSEEE